MIHILETGFPLPFRNDDSGIRVEVTLPPHNCGII